MKHNRADIKRETHSDHPLKESSRQQMEIAGKNLAPWGYEYEGSATIHYYKKHNTHDFVFITHLSKLELLPEGQADVGLKELRRALMGYYGREDKRRTDTKEEIL